MSLPKRVALVSSSVLLVALLAGGVWVYRSLSYVPAFYAQALAVDKPELERSNREMLRVTAVFNNALKRSGQWQIVFTDRQINGWLAVDVPRNHPDLLPPEVRDPRARITPQRLFAAAQYDGDVSAVVSLEVDVRLTETNVVAVRIHKIRVGDVPWALDRIVDDCIQAARDWGLHVEQTQTDGDPVLLITVPPYVDRYAVTLVRLELRDGAVFLAGETTPARRQGQVRSPH